MGWQAAAYCRGECWGGNSGFPDDSDTECEKDDDPKCNDDDDDDDVVVVESESVTPPRHDSQMAQAGLIAMFAFLHVMSFLMASQNPGKTLVAHVSVSFSIMAAPDMEVQTSHAEADGRSNDISLTPAWA
eukprot:s4346_g6.t1